MTEHLIMGNENIYKILQDSEGRAPISYSTFLQVHVPQMRKLGIIFDFTKKRGKRKPNCAWPSKVQLYFQMWAQEKWTEKNMNFEKLIGKARDVRSDL